jgi:hypothetical protein
VYRIAETIRVILFITLSITIFQFYPVTALMIVLLAILNDLPIITIAYDNVRLSDKPKRWDMRTVLGIATSLGGNRRPIHLRHILHWVERFQLRRCGSPILYLSQAFGCQASYGFCSPNTRSFLVDKTSAAAVFGRCIHSAHGHAYHGLRDSVACHGLGTCPFRLGLRFSSLYNY